MDVFPERMQDFQSLIPPLIDVVKDKVDLVRKNAAMCLAKLCKDEDNARVMREHHGSEILVSLGSNLLR